MKIFISWPGEISHKIALALREGLPLFCPLLNRGYLLVLEIAVWTDEEGSRSAPATIASGVFAGAFAAEYGLSRKDRDGKTIGEELDRIATGVTRVAALQSFLRGAYGGGATSSGREHDGRRRDWHSRYSLV